MFRFREVSLFGWDLWPPCRIPLDRDVVLLTGPNGSGKTTLLDAIRQLLNAPRLSSRRRLQHYLRRPDMPTLLRAVVSNEAADGAAPPFRHERITTPEATLACMLVPAGGAPEKRFAVLPGRPDVEEVRRRLLESREWYPPEQYGRALERAGVTRSLMGVLAIEQGRTNALFELKPRELFQQVLEMMGDRAVLERYSEARRRYEDSERELSRQLVRLRALQVELEGKQREVRRLDAWEEARDRVADLEMRLPAAELQVVLGRREEAAGKIPELRTKVRRGEAERERLDNEVEKAHAAEASAHKGLEAAKSTERAAQDTRDRALSAQAALEARAKDLEAKERESAAMAPRDLAALERAADEAAEAAYAARHAVSEAERLRASAELKVERLRAGLPVYPESVVRALEAFAAAGIAATLLAATLEVADAARAEATEAALGDARYALIVRPEQERLGIEIARREGFPGPVYAGPRAAAAGRAGPIAFSAGAPAWLEHWFERVRLDQSGAWHDERGTWVGGVGQRLLGASGIEVELRRAEADAAEAEAGLAAARRAVESAEARKRQADEARSRERRRQELLAEVRHLSELRADLARADQAMRVADEALQQAAVAREAEANRLSKVLRELDDLGRTLNKELLPRLQGEQDALAHAEAEAMECDRRIAELEAGIRPDLIERARRGELDGPDTVRRDLERAKEQFANLGDPPPTEVREEARHLQLNIEEAERHAAARRREAEEAQTELAACRRHYLEVVSGALHDYRRRAEDLGRRADVVVEMELPRLEDDDRVLDEATLHARFGFDGKEPLPLGDPSFSGGQQVIAGLIVLMAMAETDGQGFFILDEPFAHLSLDRVDDVGRFLRSTHSQFILTAPTTLDRAQLDPASLVIVLTKKRLHEPHAPVPIVAVA